MPSKTVPTDFGVGVGDFGVEQGEPLVRVQALVADPVVERPDKPIAPRHAWWNISNLDLVFAELAECFTDKFGAVVATDQHGHTTLGDAPFESCNEVLASDLSGG